VSKIKIIPKFTKIYETELNQEEIVEILSHIIETDLDLKKRNFLTEKTKSKKNFEGTIRQNSFSINRFYHTRKSFWIEANGIIKEKENKTLIRINYKFDLQSTISFFAIYGILFLLTIIMIIISFIDIIGLLFLLFYLVILLILHFSFKSYFNSETSRLLRFLSNKLKLKEYNN